MIFAKKQGRSSSNTGLKYKKYVAGKYTQARAPLAKCGGGGGGGSGYGGKTVEM